MDEMPPAVTEFVGSAREFCATIEAVGPEAEWLQIARSLMPLLADLAAGVHRLPDVDPTNIESGDLISHADWGQRFNTLLTALGPRDPYWTVFEPFDAEIPEPVPGSLADDLSDIWRDLANGLVALDNGAHWEDVAWEWKFGHESHWGRHAVESLRVLHMLTT